MKECPYCRKVACVCEKPAHVPDRLAALEQRVGALEARAEDSDAEPCDDPELRALNAQIDRDCNVESTESHMLLDENGIAPAPVGTRNCKRLQRRIEFMIATLATARRERDEAVSVVRRCAVGLGDPCKRDCSHDACWVISEARALVAGQGEDPRQNLTAECEMWKDQARDAEQLRSDRAARDAEIAGLKVRAEKAEANYAFMVKRAADEKLDGYRELGARAAAAESAADALRARIAELEARDRKAGHALVGVAHRIVEGRSCWCLGEYKPESGHTLVCRMARALVVSEEAHPDPARGLIERCLDAVDGRAMALRADLRAYLGGG